MSHGSKLIMPRSDSEPPITTCRHASAPVASGERIRSGLTGPPWQIVQNAKYCASPSASWAGVKRSSLVTYGRGSIGGSRASLPVPPSLNASSTPFGGGRRIQSLVVAMPIEPP